jgi:hypothetical protein
MVLCPHQGKKTALSRAAAATQLILQLILKAR